MIGRILGRRRPCPLCGEACGRGLVCGCRYARAQRSAVASLALMWVSAGPLMAMQSSPHGAVTESEIAISLPVFVASLLASIGFTWVVAKYDNERLRRQERFEERQSLQLRQLQERLDELGRRFPPQAP